MLHIDLFSKAQMDDAYQKSLLISADRGLTKAQTIGYLQMCINTLQDGGELTKARDRANQWHNKYLDTLHKLREARSKAASIAQQARPVKPKRWNPRTPKTLRNIIKWYSGRLYRWSLKKNV